MAIVRKIVIAGDTKEISQYHISHIPRGARRKKEKESPERIKKSNLRHQRDRLRQLMNANFENISYTSHTLTYRQGEEPKTVREVRNDARIFVKRLRKCAALFNTDLKFIYVIGAGEGKRKHIHIVTNTMPDRAIVSGCWHHGHVKFSPLYGNDAGERQYKDLADYYMKNAIETKQYEEDHGETPGKMYVPSRNMIQPKEEKRIVFGKLKIEAEPGYHIEKDSIYQGITSMGFPLQRYTLIRGKHEGDQDIHSHRRADQSMDKVHHGLLHPVHKRRTDGSGADRSGSRRRASEGGHAGSAHIYADADRRRERSAGHSHMPLSRSHSSHKSVAVFGMVKKWVEKLARK